MKLKKMVIELIKKAKYISVDISGSGFIEIHEDWFEGFSIEMENVPKEIIEQLKIKLPDNKYLKDY